MMWKVFLAGALIFLLQPVAAWGPWWRIGIIVVFVILTGIALLVGELKDQLSHG